MSLTSQFYKDKSKDHDHVYVNFQLVNNSHEGIPAIINETRTASIIDNPSEYHLIVLRAVVPSTEIFFFQFQDNQYWITLTYNGVDYQQAVIFETDDLASTTGRGIYSVRGFLKMINDAYATQFALLIAANPSCPVQTPPFFTYESGSELITLNGEPNYDPNIAGVPTIQVWTNSILFNYFLTIEPVYFVGYNQPDRKDIQMRIINLYNNLSTVTTGGPIYLRMVSEFVPLGSWNDLTTLVLTSTKLPTAVEYVPSNTQAVSTGSIFNVPPGNVGTSANATQKIITDFVPDRSKLPIDQIVYQYVPTSEYRRIDLESNQPIKDIDIQFSWTNKLGQLIPIRLYPGESCNLKLLFERRSDFLMKKSTENF